MSKYLLSYDEEDVKAGKLQVDSEGVLKSAGGVLYVDITWDESNPDPINMSYLGTSSRTLAEIIEAAQNGISVVARRTTDYTDSFGAGQIANYYPLSGYITSSDVTRGYAEFMVNGFDGECFWSYNIVVYPNGNVKARYYETTLGGSPE